MQRDRGQFLEIVGWDARRHTDCPIPSLPLSRRFGRRAGRTVGSCSESSKFGWKATVSLSMSSSMWAAILPRRDSVYLILDGRISVNGAEVPLTVHQRVPETEGLSHSDHRLVDGGVAVWVELPHDLANGPCGFRIGASSDMAGLMHAIEHTTVNEV